MEYKWPDIFWSTVNFSKTLEPTHTKHNRVATDPKRMKPEEQTLAADFDSDVYEKHKTAAKHSPSKRSDPCAWVFKAYTPSHEFTCTQEKLLNHHKNYMTDKDLRETWDSACIV